MRSLTLRVDDAITITSAETSQPAILPSSSFPSGFG